MLGRFSPLQVTIRSLHPRLSCTVLSGGKHIANFDAEVWVNLDYDAVNQRRPAVSAKPDDEVTGEV